MKYIITYNTKFGALSAESDFPDDLLVGYQTLENLAVKLEKSKISVVRKTSGGRKVSQTQKQGGETARILREIDSKLLNGSFFSKPKTTGDTKKKLVEVSGRNFTSRKVSQALGILWKKGTLKRTGTRNYFAYSTT